MGLDQKGLKRLGEVFGTNGLDVTESLRSICPEFTEYLVNFAFGDLYSRKVLSDKDRELVAVGSLITQNKKDLPLKVHFNVMLNVGWTKKEIVDLIIFLIGYVGFPSTVEAIKTMHEVFKEREDK